MVTLPGEGRKVFGSSALIRHSIAWPLNVMSDEIAERTAEDWVAYNDSAFAHFEALKAMLDRVDPSYRD